MNMNEPLCHFGRSRAPLAIYILGILVGCAESDGGSTAPAGSQAGAICTYSCPKKCDADSDCDASQGKICCAFGNDGNACVDANECPRFCNSDTQCDGDEGKICCQVSLVASESVCADPTECVKQCATNDDCGDEDVCCVNVSPAICVSPSQCPQPCTSATDCDTESGQLCCASARLARPYLTTEGACVYSGSGACPKTCSASLDCNTEEGELCCNGQCATSCDKSCSSNNDCDTSDGELCCDNPVRASPWYGGNTPNRF